VKVIHEHLADDSEIRGRFYHEARHAAALVHPHIVAVYDQGIDALPNGAGGTPLPYMVMELIDGPSLREVLHQRGRLSPAEALAVVLPVCDALTRAHTRGVVHRDIKPENVLIGEGGLPKVADFGIAHAISATSQTTTGTLIGSVHYLAPELIQGRQSSPASDQYAVGVLLFELLTGRKPLPADTAMAVVARHVKEPIPPPSRFAPHIPAALDEVVLRATALDASLRFPDLLALAAALRSAVPAGAEPVDVGGNHTLVIPATGPDRWPAMPVEVGRLPSWRPSGATARVLALLLVLAFGIGLYTVWNRVAGPVRTVPALAGMTLQQAAGTLDRLGLLFVEAGSQPSLRVPEGSVVSHEPPPGTRLRRGETVTIVVSSGPAVVEMPRVLGLAEDEAREALSRHGFTVTREEGYSDTAAEGTVDAQLPDPGAPIREGTGSEVAIHISLGKEPVEVPDLSGTDQDEAEELLAEAGLEGSFTREYSDDMPDEGEVVRQSIGGGTTVDKGTTVEVVVSGGPLTVRMPDVRGMPVTEAKAALEAEGFPVTVSGQPRRSFGPLDFGRLGRVEDQAPQPGADVRRGDEITLVTYVGG